jgi:hypothetical protein
VPTAPLAAFNNEKRQNDWRIRGSRTSGDACKEELHGRARDAATKGRPPAHEHAEVAAAHDDEGTLCRNEDKLARCASDPMGSLPSFDRGPHVTPPRKNSHASVPFAPTPPTAERKPRSVKLSSKRNSDPREKTELTTTDSPEAEERLARASSNHNLTTAESTLQSEAREQKSFSAFQFGGNGPQGTSFSPSNVAFRFGAESTAGGDSSHLQIATFSDNTLTQGAVPFANECRESVYGINRLQQWTESRDESGLVIYTPPPSTEWIPTSYLLSSRILAVDSRNSDSWLLDFDRGRACYSADRSKSVWQSVQPTRRLSFQDGSGVPCTLLEPDRSACGGSREVGTHTNQKLFGMLREAGDPLAVSAALYLA